MANTDDGRIDDSTAKNSREKILRAAEQIFAKKGLAGASVRAITSAAGVNHAAIGYYFGSKVALYEEVLERATELGSRPRLARLAELREEHGEAPIPIRELLDTYIRSFFDDYSNPESISRTWLRFYGRCFSEQDDEVFQATIRAGDHLRSVFLQEFERTLPELSRKELVYRFGALIGVMAFWRGGTQFMDAHFEEEQERINVDELVETVISICFAIFTAGPAPKPSATSRTRTKKVTLQKSITSQNETGDKSKSATIKSRRHRKRGGQHAKS